MDILKEFHQWRPELPYLMEQCSHHYNPPYDLNPYHLEGGVLVHSMMVLNNLPKNFRNIVLALCHDIGKIYTRHITDHKVRFSGHEFASIQDTIDFLYHLKNKGYIEDIETEFYYILSVISAHMNTIKGDMSVEKKRAYLNHDLSLIMLAQQFSQADKNGAIVDSSATEKEDREIELFEGWFGSPEAVDIEDCDVIFTCGVPGCGKDYIAEKEFPDAAIVSFDDIRVELFKESLDTEYEGTDAELYRDAFNYVNENKINLNNYLRNEVNMHLDTSVCNRVVICNTSLGRKRRRGLINELGQKTNRKFGVLFVTAKSNTIKERNRNRDSKVIPETVMSNFLLNQQIPSFADGFDVVEFIDNEKER